MRVVLDTNVVVSAFLSPSGVPAQIIEEWQRQAFEVAASEPLITEYRRALLYPGVAARHRLSADDVADTIEDMQQLVVMVSPQETLFAVVDDPDDNRVLECAVAGDVEYIVSGDAHLLALQQFRDIQVLSPAAFLVVLRQAKQDNTQA